MPSAGAGRWQRGGSGGPGGAGGPRDERGVQGVRARSTRSPGDAPLELRCRGEEAAALGDERGERVGIVWAVGEFPFQKNSIIQSLWFSFVFHLFFFLI